MPSGKHKSRTFRRVFVKTPGNRTVLHHRKAKPKKATCSKCKKVLPGVASERPYVLRKMSKSAKRPERPYGGILCSSCTRATMKEKAKAMSTAIGDKK